MLAQIVAAAAQGAGKETPSALQGIETAAAADVIAASLLSGERRAILLGNYAIQHPDASQIIALAQALASITGATLGVCTEAANTVGGYVAGALPQKDGLNAQAMLGTNGAESRHAYVVLHAEPEFDCANPVAARAALEKADLVVVLSEFRTAMRYADVLLPIAPFTETSGTFVNCEGRVQRFHGVVQPAGESRPGWKVLRVLGTMLALPGFGFDSSEEIRDAVLGAAGDLERKLSNGTRVEIIAPRRPARRRAHRRRPDPFCRSAGATLGIVGHHGRESRQGTTASDDARPARARGRRADQDSPGTRRGGARDAGGSCGSAGCRAHRGRASVDVRPRRAVRPDHRRTRMRTAR